jgi:hypothetical protein
MMSSRPNFEFTVPMALEDFIPVVFTAIGLIILSKYISAKYSNLSFLAWVGTNLVISDGVLKAVWKLIYAAAGTDIAWMKDSLFVLMGPGFIFVSWALWRGLKDKISTAKQIWLVPLIIVIPSLILSYYLATTQESRAWARVLLTLTTVGILFTNGQIIFSCVKNKLYLPIILLIINIITIFGQAFLSQLPQTTALHWIGQLNNTVSWAAFAVGIWIWQRYLRDTGESHD